MEIKPKQITWDKIPKDWWVQPKYDGECCKLIIHDGVVDLQRFGDKDKDGDKELELTQKILKRYEEFQEQLP